MLALCVSALYLRNESYGHLLSGAVGKLRVGCKAASMEPCAGSLS